MSICEKTPEHDGKHLFNQMTHKCVYCGEAIDAPRTVIPIKGERPTSDELAGGLYLQRMKGEERAQQDYAELEKKHGLALSIYDAKLRDFAVTYTKPYEEVKHTFLDLMETGIGGERSWIELPRVYDMFSTSYPKMTRQEYNRIMWLLRRSGQTLTTENIAKVREEERRRAERKPPFDLKRAFTGQTLNGAVEAARTTPLDQFSHEAILERKAMVRVQIEAFMADEEKADREYENTRKWARNADLFGVDNVLHDIQREEQKHKEKLKILLDTTKWEEV